MEYGFLEEKHKNFTPMVLVGVTNVCNNRCIMCPYSQIIKEGWYKPEFMSEELYKKIVDEVALYPETILRMTPDGEVLIHPKAIDFVKYAKDKGVALVSFDTNGLAFTEEKAKGLLDAGLDLVNFSLNAFKRETHQKIQYGSDFDAVMKNIHRFIDMRNQGRHKTKITVSIVDQPEVKDEISDFITYWTSRVDYVMRRKYLGIMGFVGKEKENFQQTNRWPCKFIFTRTDISQDGYMRFCNDDWYRQTVVGNVKYQTISEIWQSKLYEMIRKHHLKGDYHKNKYCEDCTEWQSAEWDYDYFYAVKRIF